MIELPGHGNTPADDDAFTMDGFVSHVVARMDEDGVEVADFFGFSMGGYLALVLAHMHPVRVRRVVTLGTMFDWTRETASRESRRLDTDTIRRKVPAFARQLEARHERAGGWERVLARTASLLTALGESPPLDSATFAAIDARACIAVGDRDATVSVEQSASVARQLVNGCSVVLPDTAHPFEQVDHAALATLIRSQLQ